MAVRARRSVSSILGILLVLGPLAPHAHAQTTPAAATATQPEAAAQARAHFQKARDLYQAGAYREAIAELDEARRLDPSAKDLVFNLGVVHEKLGHIDVALAFYKQYSTMNLEPAERARAEAYIKRLQGAKSEVVVPVAPAPTAAPAPLPMETPSKGRIDAATLVAGSFALVGFGVGIGFGVKALSDAPKSSFVTGVNGTYGQLANETTTSHREAMIADVGYAVGLAATALTAYLYFARSKVPSSASTKAAVAGVPLTGGGAVLVRGSF